MAWIEACVLVLGAGEKEWAKCYVWHAAEAPQGNSVYHYFHLCENPCSSEHMNFHVFTLAGM